MLGTISRIVRVLSVVCLMLRDQGKIRTVSPLYSKRIKACRKRPGEFVLEWSGLLQPMCPLCTLGGTPCPSYRTVVSFQEQGFDKAPSLGLFSGSKGRQLWGQ